MGTIKGTGTKNRPISSCIGNHSNEYSIIIKRIVNGYRFPSFIPKGIYSVYANFLAAKTERTEIEEEYLKMMKELNPIWPEPDKVYDPSKKKGKKNEQ